MEAIQFNLVGGLSQKKKARIIMALMAGNLITAVTGGFILKNNYILLCGCFVFFAILYFLKFKFSKVTRIGTMTFGENSIELNNPKQSARRSVALSSINSVSLRNGIKASEDDTREYTTMYLDFHLKTGENLPVHIEVTEIDDHTKSLIDNYFKIRNIGVNQN